MPLIPPLPNNFCLGAVLGRLALMAVIRSLLDEDRLERIKTKWWELVATYMMVVFYLTVSAQDFVS